VEADAGITGILLALLLLAPALVAADGMAFRYDHGSSLEPLHVDEQRAFIAHKDGIQRMFIAINLPDLSSGENTSTSAVWIFPVPGGADRAHVDVTDFMPNLKGEDVEQAFRNLMEYGPLIPMVTQPHFLPLFAFPFFRPFGYAGRLEGAQRFSGVTTHKTVERWGIHAELITAVSMDHVATYLRGKNVNVEPELLNPFSPYLSDKYALVVAWISSRKELTEKFPQHEADQGQAHRILIDPKVIEGKSRPHKPAQPSKWPTLYVEFPSDKPFYPMRPTSGYGKKSVRVTLFVLGWVAPDTSSWTASEKSRMSPQLSYFEGKRASFDRNYEIFLAERAKDAQATGKKDESDEVRKSVARFLTAIPEGEIPYTRVRLRSPAENFTQDLRFDPSSRPHMMHTISTSPWVVPALVILLAVALSYVSAGIAGKALFKAWRPWARIGLWNCFTVGVLVAAAWVTTRAAEAEGKPASASPRRDALVFGVLAFFPLVMLLMAVAHPLARSPDNPSVQALGYVLTAVLLLIVSWIVAKAGTARPHEGPRNPEQAQGLMPCRTRETMVRIVLLLAAPVAVVLGPVLFAPIIVGPPPPGVGSGFLLWRTLRAVGQLFLACAAITAGPLIVSWVLRRVGAAWQGKRRSIPEGDAEGLSLRKPEPLILGALACIVLLTIVIFAHSSEKLWAFDSLIRVACRALVLFELIVATWVLWKVTSTSISREDRFSPTWPVALAVLVPLGALCGILIYGAASALGPMLMLYPTGRIEAYDHAIPAITLLGMIVIAVFLNRRRIKLLIRDMTYNGALSVIFVVLAVLSYLAVHGLIVTSFVREMHLGDVLATLALIAAAWLVKGELQDKPTKALRFGVLFSIVFTILNIAVFVGLKALLAGAIN